MRKVMLVFEETEASPNGQGEQGFKVYLAGDIERIGKSDAKHLSAAEFWGLRAMQIMAGTLVKSGAVDDVTKKAPDGVVGH